MTDTRRRRTSGWRYIARHAERVVRLSRYVLEDAAGLAADVAFAVRDKARDRAGRRKGRPAVSPQCMPAAGNTISCPDIIGRCEAIEQTNG